MVTIYSLDVLLFLFGTNMLFLVQFHLLLPDCHTDFPSVNFSTVGYTDIYTCYVFILDWSLDHYVVSFLVSCNLLYFKVYFVLYGDCYSNFLFLPICMEYFFPSSHFQSICVFRSDWSGFLIRSDQSLRHVRLFATPWIAACQASLSITNSQSSLRLKSIESVMPSSHLILCCPLLLLPPIPPSIRVFSNAIYMGLVFVSIQPVCVFWLEHLLCLHLN